VRCDERSFRRSIDIEIYGVVVNPERNSATSPPEVLYIFVCRQQFTRKLLKLGNGIMDIIILTRKLKDSLFSAAKENERKHCLLLLVVTPFHHSRAAADSYKHPFPMACRHANK
jgi:hypothetical protein